MEPRKRFDLAYRLLDEARKLLPANEPWKCVQASEKVWETWAQAVKAYKPWRTSRGYDAAIGELYKVVPNKHVLRDAHRSPSPFTRGGSTRPRPAPATWT
jgi:hypothetical protein